MEIQHCKLSDEGEPYLEKTLPEDASVQVADTWYYDKMNGVPPLRGAFVGKGYNKQGVKVRTLLVIFHSKLTELILGNV